MTQVSQAELIQGAIAGKVVSFPTDTVPALAVRPDCADLIFELKERDRSKPLILMGSSWTDLLPYLQGTPWEIALWQQVAQEYWPGPLTLVLPASPVVPRAVNPHDPNTIGLRVPALDLALSLLAQTGPLATTSANRSGEPPLETMTGIEEAFPEVLTLHSSTSTANSKLGSGLPSTVVKWTEMGWEMLRRGTIKEITTPRI